MQASGLAGQRVLSQVGTTGCRDAAADFVDVLERRKLVFGSPLQFSFAHEGSPRDQGPELSTTSVSFRLLSRPPAMSQDALSAFTPRNRPEELLDHPCRSAKVAIRNDTDGGCRPRSARFRRVLPRSGKAWSGLSRNEKVRGSNPLSSTTPAPRLTCGNAHTSAALIGHHAWSGPERVPHVCPRLLRR